MKPENQSKLSWRRANLYVLFVALLFSASCSEPLEIPSMEGTWDASYHFISSDFGVDSVRGGPSVFYVRQQGKNLSIAFSEEFISPLYGEIQSNGEFRVGGRLIPVPVMIGQEPKIIALEISLKGTLQSDCRSCQGEYAWLYSDSLYIPDEKRAGDPCFRYSMFGSRRNR